MIQLAFEPAFDPFHAAFRLLRQAVFRESNHSSIPRVKLIDFFVAEPRRCLDIRVPPALKSAAKKAAANQFPTYGRRPSGSNLFNRMGALQDAAIQTLVLQGFFEADAFTRGVIKLSETSLPINLAERIADINSKQHDLMEFLCFKLDEIPYDSINGLKHRTGLGEYRYDIV